MSEVFKLHNTAHSITCASYGHLDCQYFFIFLLISSDFNISNPSLTYISYYYVALRLQTGMTEMTD